MCLLFNGVGVGIFAASFKTIHFDIISEFELRLYDRFLMSASFWSSGSKLLKPEAIKIEFKKVPISSVIII